MSEMFDALYPDAAVPKNGWRWIEAVQRRLLRHGTHRAWSAVDLLICATAAHHDLAILHDDKDFVAAARYLPNLRERAIHDAPQAEQQAYGHSDLEPRPVDCGLPQEFIREFGFGHCNLVCGAERRCNG